MASDKCLLAIGSGFSVVRGAVVGNMSKNNDLRGSVNMTSVPVGVR